MNLNPTPSLGRTSALAALVLTLLCTAPAAAQAAEHGTFTSVTCAPEPVAAGSPTTCTVTVTDYEADPGTPTGDVSFTSSEPADTPPADCTLTAGSTAGQASCSVSFTPTGRGGRSLTASYEGVVDAFAPSTSSAWVTPQSDTTTAVVCDPAALRAGTATTCTATVTDTASTPVAPTGTVVFTSSWVGSWTPTNRTCTLVPGGSGSSSCSVTHTPTNQGAQTITGTYAGGNGFAGSFGRQDLDVDFVAPHPTETAVDCAPDPIQATSSAVCLVTVTDLDTTGTQFQKNARPPTGLATVDVDVPGSYHPGSKACQLNPSAYNQSSCTVVYAPGQAGNATVEADYPGSVAHVASSDQSPLVITDPPPDAQSPTTTSVSCTPESPVVGTKVSCTATVADAGESPAAPAGAVAVTATGGGVSSAEQRCALTTAGPGRSRCVFSYEPRTAGVNTIAVRYAGTGVHRSSQGEAAVSVAARPAGPTSPPPVKPKARAKLTMAGISATARRTLARSGRLTVRLSAPAAGSVKARLLARLSKRGRTRVVGTATARARKKGRVTVTLRLSRAARRALARNGRLTVRVEARFGRQMDTTRFTLTATRRGR